MMERVAVVIPAHNESKTIVDIIHKTHEVLKREGWDYKIIVVDDGSSDGSYESVLGNGAIAVRHMVNMGKGFTLRTGAEAALQEGAEIIVNMDADNQHHPEDIPRLVNRLKEENLDIVFGSRQLDGNMPLIFRLGNFGLSLSAKLLFGMNIKDTQSGFRAFTREAYEMIKWTSGGYPVESEMIVNASKKGLKYDEMPIHTVYHEKYKGTTLLTGINVFSKMLWWRLR